MQFINYFLASLMSFSGLLIGFFLVKTAPEEQKPLRKYFAWTKRALLLLIFAFFIFYYHKNMVLFVVLSMLLAILLFFEFTFKDLLKKSVLDYSVFAFLFFFSSNNPSLFAIESSLILFYGMPASSLIYKRKSRANYRIFLYNSVFIAIANSLFAAYHFSFLIFR